MQDPNPEYLIRGKDESVCAIWTAGGKIDHRKDFGRGLQANKVNLCSYYGNY